MIMNICIIFAYAENNIENWSYDTSTNTLTISGTGETAGFVGEKRNYYYFDIVENLIIEEGITGIGTYAFSRCTNLKNVQFPDSLRIIRSYAFEYTAIKELTIPKNVKDINGYAFSSIESLEIVNMYAESINISANAFYYCNIYRVNINNLSNWCAYEFSISGSSSNPVEFADLYLNGELITNLIIPDGVTSIEASAFYCCNSIESVTICRTVEHIKTKAFNYCENLKTVYIPKNVIGIAYTAFSNSSNLTDIYYEGTKEEFNNLFTKTPAIPNVTVVHYLDDHEHNFELVKIVEPKCNAKGYTKYECTICGDTYRGNITEILGHSYTISQIIEPTCIDEGYTVYSCIRCNRTYNSDFVDKGKHTYSVEIIASTCTSEGINKYTCTLCGDTVNSYLEILPHFYNYDSFDGEFYHYSCKDCNKTNLINENNMPKFIDYVNTYVSRESKNMYLDMVPDGIINAKDFAKIQHI